MCVAERRGGGGGGGGGGGRLVEDDHDDGLFLVPVNPIAKKRMATRATVPKNLKRLEGVILNG